MSKIRKHAITVVLIAAVVALGLMIWSKKVASVPGGGDAPAGTATQSAGGKPPAQ